MVDDRQLAEELMRLDIVPREQLKRGRELQLEDGTTLYEALMSHGVVDEPVLVDLAARILNIPSVDLATYEIPDHVANLITEAIARTNRVVPLAQKGAQLLLAMVDPLDIMAMDEVSTHTSIDIQPVLAGPSDIERTIERLYASAYVGTEDSWGEFFEDGMFEERAGGAASGQDVVTRESSDISQEMRDRPSSLEMSFDDLGIAIDEDDEPPGSPIVQENDGVPIFELVEEQEEEEGVGGPDSEPALDLGSWEMDVPSQNAVPDAIAVELSESDEDNEEAIYAKIGTAYVLDAADEDVEDDSESDLIEGAVPEPIELEELEEIDDEELLELEEVPIDGEGIGEPDVSAAFDEVFAALDEPLDPIEQSNNPTGTQMAGVGLNFARLNEHSDESQELPVYQPPEEDDLELELSDDAVVEFELDEIGELDEPEPLIELESEPEPEAELDSEPEDEEKPSGLAALRLSFQKTSLLKPSELERPKGSASRSASKPKPIEAPPVADESPSGSALGRVKVKKIELRPESSGLRAPVVERSSYLENAVDPTTVKVAEGPVHTQELEPEDILDEVVEESAPVLLDGSEEQGGLGLGLDQSNEAPVARTREFSDRDESTLRVRKPDPSVDDLVNPLAEEHPIDIGSEDSEPIPEDSPEALLEETLAGDEGQTKQKIDELRASIRSHEGETDAEEEEGQVPPSSGAGDKPRKNPLTVTQENQAITLEQIHRMKREPTGKSKALEARADPETVMRDEPIFDFPTDVDQESLLRAALMILVGKGLIDFDELVEMARMLAEE